MIGILLLINMTGLISSSEATPLPEMPPSFERKTVQSLVDNIDQGDNATIIKFGYFIRRNPEWLTLSEGLEILRSAVNKEPVGTKRWFLLQQVRAFAAPRSGKSTWQEGLISYQDSLLQSAKSKEAGAEDVLQRTIYEFVAAVGTKTMWNLSDFPESRSVLQHALKAHLEYLKVHNKTPFRFEWDRAIRLVRGNEELKNIALSMLHDPPKAKEDSFDFLFTIAIVLGYSDVPSALEALDRAEPLLDSVSDIEKAAFFERRIQFLRKTDRVSDALTQQKKQIAETGGGYAQLIETLLESKNEKGIKEFLLEVQSPKVKEAEVVTVAYLLWNNGRNIEMMALLENYLETDRERSIEKDLEMRVLLAQAYLEKERWEEATELTVIPHIKPPLPTENAQMYYDALQNVPRLIVDLRGKQ